LIPEVGTRLDGSSVNQGGGTGATPRKARFAGTGGR
jgi:hypothetical protein